MSRLFHWHTPSALAALGWFIVLVALATVGAHLGWLRGFGGDVLAVIWLYCVLRSVLALPPTWLALAAFGCGVLVEAGQYLASVQHWHIDNRALRIVLGATADWLDVLAYALGLLIILLSRRLRR